MEEPQYIDGIVRIGTSADYISTEKEGKLRNWEKFIWREFLLRKQKLAIVQMLVSIILGNGNLCQYEQNRCCKENICEKEHILDEKKRDFSKIVPQAAATPTSLSEMIALPHHCFFAVIESDSFGLLISDFTPSLPRIRLCNSGWVLSNDGKHPE